METDYLQEQFNTSDPLEGQDQERLQALSLTDWVTLELLERTQEVFVLLP